MPERLDRLVARRSRPFHEVTFSCWEEPANSKIEKMKNGEMAEWLKALLSKSSIRVTVSRVRIPVSPLVFYAYILKSLKNNTYYYGHTSDLDKRVKQHNLGKTPYTKNLRPWVLHYFESFVVKSDAIVREKFFKSIDGYNWLKSNKII